MALNGKARNPRTPYIWRVRLAGSIRRVLFAVLACACVGSAWVPSAGAKVVTKSPGAVRAYWTPERMRQALPAALIEPGGATTFSAGPAAAKHGSLHAVVPKPRARGVRTAGKVFFSKGLFDYECSGTVVRSPSRRLVLSAGHCAYIENAIGNGGGYPTNWMFVPAYSKRNGTVNAPFGKWAASRLEATPGWVDSVNSITSSGDSRFDVSAAILAKRKGKAIQDVVGARTPRFNASRQATYDAIGYPAEGQFNGNTEFECRSPLTQSDGSLGQPATLGIACDMTGGSSGGGWIVKNRYIESVTSYSYNSDPNTLYGPYFGPAIKAFYDSVKNG
jgi:V8-like Glu-specific endopeptidase